MKEPILNSSVGPWRRTLRPCSQPVPPASWPPPPPSLATTQGLVPGNVSACVGERGLEVICFRRQKCMRAPQPALLWKYFVLFRGLDGSASLRVGSGHRWFVFLSATVNAFSTHRGKVPCTSQRPGLHPVGGEACEAGGTAMCRGAGLGDSAGSGPGPPPPPHTHPPRSEQLGCWRPCPFTAPR